MHALCNFTTPQLQLTQALLLHTTHSFTPILFVFFSYTRVKVHCSTQPLRKAATNSSSHSFFLQTKRLVFGKHKRSLTAGSQTALLNLSGLQL